MAAALCPGRVFHSKAGSMKKSFHAHSEVDGCRISCPIWLMMAAVALRKMVGVGSVVGVGMICWNICCQETWFM